MERLKEKETAIGKISLTVTYFEKKSCISNRLIVTDSNQYLKTFRRLYNVRKKILFRKWYQYIYLKVGSCINNTFAPRKAKF